MSLTFQQKLTGDIYAIVSEFLDKAWLGLRKCYPTKRQFYVGKQGVNLDFEQFTILRLNFNKILNAVSNKKSFTFELGTEKMGVIDKTSCYTLKLLHGSKEIFLDITTLKKLEAFFLEIESKMVQLGKKIRGNDFFLIFIDDCFNIIFLQKSKWRTKMKWQTILVSFF